MSKTWKNPEAIGEQIVQHLFVGPGGDVSVGSKIAALYSVQMGADFPAVPVTSPMAGKVLFFPGIVEGAKVAGGEKVFSVLSDLDWEILGRVAGREKRNQMIETPVKMSKLEFEQCMDQMVAAVVEFAMRR